MEGTMCKWTNYLSGWQPRWFVLNNGVLSYYKSQEDVNNGCKGSVKMSVCDVVVHPTDRTRLDLIIPGEQHFYVKPATPQERQQWLVALGSCKATSSNGIPPEDIGDISPDRVKTKKSELRLYCDLLMQQIHSVKAAVTENIVPDIEKLDEASSLLSATCDTFIYTLDDCMKIANASIVYEMPHQHVTDAVSPPSPTRIGHKRLGSRSPLSSVLSISMDHSSNQHLEHGRSHRHRLSGRHSLDENPVHGQWSTRSSTVSESSDVSTTEIGKSESPIPLNNIAESVDVFKDIPDEIPNFFSVMENSFNDIKLEHNGEVLVRPFLAACRAIVPFFDKLNSTAFVPVRMDFTGNIKKIQEKYDSNPAEFSSIQKMILHEINLGQHTAPTSATVAMLWLKRSLSFLKELMCEILHGEMDLAQAAYSAYSRSLKPYHGLVIRGVFTLAVKALPYREVFLRDLATTREDADKSGFEHSLMMDIETFVTAEDIVLTILNDFYVAHNLEATYQV